MSDLEEDLLEAVYDEDLPRVRELLPQVPVEARVRALKEAIEYKIMASLKCLVAAGVPLQHSSCNESCYPLHKAVEVDNAEAVALLLEAKARPGVTSHHFNPPLYEATSARVARLLLDAGANAVGNEYQTPLHRAAFYGREDVLQVLLAQPGVDIESKDMSEDWDLTALHNAASCETPGGVACVAALLSAGADPCAVNAEGWGPLSDKAIRGPQEIFWIPGSQAARESRERITELLVTSPRWRWKRVEKGSPCLDMALFTVWKKTPEKLPRLFKRLETKDQKWVQEALRVLHHGGLDEPLKMAVIGEALDTWW